jgi:hypothetical protein
MKKIGIALLALIVFGTSAAPAFAGGYVGATGNHYRRWQNRSDPNYWGGNYSGSRGYHAPAVGYDTFGPYPDFINGGTVFVHKKRKPRAGDTCYDANGILYGLDRDKRWYRVPGSEPVRVQYLSNVVASCGEVMAR